MTPWLTHFRSGSLALIALLVFAQGCTEKKTQKKLESLRPRRAIPENLVAVNDVRFDGNDLVALQMVRKGGSLFMTGRPFAFSRWDIGSTPEQPQLTFAASDNIQDFVMSEGGLKGSWVADFFGAGAISILGSYAYTSGAVGLSAIDISNNDQPSVKAQYPKQDVRAAQPIKDAEGAYSYKALVTHPALPILYGFREQDYVYTLSANGPTVKVVNKEAYSETGTCCVSSATIFSGKLFVAFRSAIWMFDMGADGRLSEPKILGMLQAYDVQASDNFLYVNHVPSYSSGSASLQPPGIYVFDTSGEQVAYLNVSPERFSVSADDNHLYANEDNTAIRIYRMTWK